MDALDEGEIDLSITEMEHLGQRFSEKIDNYNDYINTLEAFAGVYDKKMREFQTAKKKMEKKVDNLKKINIEIIDGSESNHQAEFTDGQRTKVRVIINVEINPI
jgi:predicted phage tail protein